MLRIAAATLVAIAVLFDASVAPSFTGSAPADGPLLAGKGDRLDAHSAVAPDCSRNAWPYYAVACLHDKRQGVQPHRVRIIPIERPHPKSAVIVARK